MSTFVRSARSPPASLALSENRQASCRYGLRRGGEAPVSRDRPLAERGSSSGIARPEDTPLRSRRGAGGEVLWGREARGGRTGVGLFSKAERDVTSDEHVRTLRALAAGLARSRRKSPGFLPLRLAERGRSSGMRPGRLRRVWELGGVYWQGQVAGTRGWPFVGCAIQRLTRSNWSMVRAAVFLLKSAFGSVGKGISRPIT